MKNTLDGRSFHIPPVPSAVCLGWEVQSKITWSLTRLAAGRQRRLEIASVAGEHEHAIGGHDDAG
jgi:hypothetical protein